MERPKFDCLCAGIVVADHLCAPISHVPAAGELVTTDRLELAIGGCAANVAVDLVKLNANVGVAGIVGADVMGRFVRDALEQSGVDCSFMTESSVQQTSGTLVINVCGEDRRFVHSVGTNAEFTAAEVTEEMVRSCRVLYLGGYCLASNPPAENVAALFEMARSAGVTTVLDVVIPRQDDYWPRLSPILPWTDVFLPNDDEARAITGYEDPVEQAEAFRAAGAGTVVITCGERGAVLLSAQERIRSQVDRLDFVDGTGSGDAFVAGFIYGLLAGKTERECLRFGSALGASCVRTTGATNGVFREDELLQFVSERELVIESF